MMELISSRRMKVKMMELIITELFRFIMMEFIRSRRFRFIDNSMDMQILLHNNIIIFKEDLQ